MEIYCVCDVHEETMDITLHRSAYAAQSHALDLITEEMELEDAPAMSEEAITQTIRAWTGSNSISVRLTIDHAVLLKTAPLPL